MKTFIKYSRALLVVMLIATAWGSKAQNPTYLCIAKNNKLVNAKVFQFDIYIRQTGTEPLYLNNYQLAFSIQNPVILVNGGNLSCSYVSGSSELTGLVPSGMNTTLLAGLKLLRINGPSLSSSGVLVPPAGLKVGTFRIANTSEYGHSGFDLVWSNAGPYNTRISALVEGIPAEITDFPSSHVIDFSGHNADKPLSMEKIASAMFVSSETTGLAEDGTLPASVNGALVSNYPNPFSEKTAIAFTLPGDDQARLEVFDMSGKRLHTLYNGDVIRNREYRAAFDGSELPAGIYIYKLTTNEAVITGKMTLNKKQ